MKHWQFRLNKVRELISPVCLVWLATLIFSACGPRPTDRSAQNRNFGSCINDLKNIDGAKTQWEMEHHAGSNAIPTWEDIRPYLGERFATDLQLIHCHAGGTYTIGRIADPPTCSYGGAGHMLE